MRRRRLLLGVGMLALLGLAGWFMLAHPLHPRPVITKANFDRIEEGMTAKQVEAILGPEGYHTKRPVVIPMSGTMSRRWWIGDDAVITISFAPKDGTPIEPPFEE